MRMCENRKGSLICSLVREVCYQKYIGILRWNDRAVQIVSLGGNVKEGAFSEVEYFRCRYELRHMSRDDDEVGPGMAVNSDDSYCQFPER